MLYSAPFYNPVSSRKPIFGQLFYFLLWVGTNFFAIFLTPSKYGHGTHQELGLPPCPSVLLFNRPCPGCGLTTSFTALIHGNLRESLEAHPLGPGLYLLFTITAWLALIGYLNKLRFHTATKIISWPIIGFVGIFFAFGIYRFITTPNYQTPYEHNLVQANSFFNQKQPTVQISKN